MPFYLTVRCRSDYVPESTHMIAAEFLYWRIRNHDVRQLSSKSGAFL